MNKLTSAELLTVAQRVMPQSNHWKWRTHYRLNGDSCVALMSEMEVLGWLDFETNHEQWRALASWCVANHCMPELFECPDDAPCSDCGHISMPEYSVCVYNRHDELVFITGFTLIDCMIAAVLALEVSEK